MTDLRTPQYILFPCSDESASPIRYAHGQPGRCTEQPLSPPPVTMATCHVPCLLPGCVCVCLCVHVCMCVCSCTCALAHKLTDMTLTPLQCASCDTHAPRHSLPLAGPLLSTFHLHAGPQGMFSFQQLTTAEGR